MVKTSAFYYYYRIVIETQNSKAKGLCFIPVEQQMLRNIKSTVSDFFFVLINNKYLGPLSNVSCFSK